MCCVCITISCMVLLYNVQVVKLDCVNNVIYLYNLIGNV